MGIGKCRIAFFGVMLLAMSLGALYMVMLSSFEVSYWEHYDKFERYHSLVVKRFILLLFFLSLAITQLFMLFNFLRHMDVKARDRSLVGLGLALTLLSLAILLSIIVLLYYLER